MNFKTSAFALLLFFAQPAYSANPEWDQANSLFNSKNYSAALSALRKLADKSPRDASIHYMIGRCYKELNKPQQANAEFDWVSKYAPDARIKSMAAAMLTQTSSTSAAAAPDTADVPSKTFINDSASQTISAAARNGWRPCPGGCLTVSKSGWHHMQVPGHSDTEMWMPFTNVEYSQAHIGHIIKDTPGSDMSQDTGACPQCNGTGWIKG